MSVTISGNGNIGGLAAGGLPNATIQQADLAANVVGNGPAFSLYQTSAQSLSAAWTKLLMNAEEFDTSSAAVTGRFTAPVAGYYQINAELAVTEQNTIGIAVYKNDAHTKVGGFANAFSVGVSCVLFLRAGDYVEIYGFSTGTPSVSASQNDTHFQGFLARAA